MSSSAPMIGSLQTTYDKKYLQFVSQVLSSSRYYNNLREQYYQNQAYNEEDEGEYHCETDAAVLYCRGTASQENEISSDSSSTEQQTLSDVAPGNANLNDCIISNDVEVAATTNTDHLFNNDLYDKDSEESEDNDFANGRNSNRTVLGKKTPCKKSKQKKKRRTRTTFDGFENTSCLENDIRDIVKSALAMDIRKQPHTDIFSLQDEDLQELRNIYGNEADEILKLEQQQELTFQKACDKIASNLLKYNVPKK